MTKLTAKQEIAQLKAENAMLKLKTEKALTLKVSQKGGLSIYGMGRFPVTLYRDQWLRLLDMADKIRSFLTDNKSEMDAKCEITLAEKAAAKIASPKQTIGA